MASESGPSTLEQSNHMKPSARLSNQHDCNVPSSMKKQGQRQGAQSIPVSKKASTVAVHSNYNSRDRKQGSVTGQKQP